MTLSAVSLPYYRFILPYGVPKFKRFAINVWNVDTAGKSDMETAKEGLSAMEQWMKELGLDMNITELGADEDMIPGIAENVAVMQGGYKILTKEDITAILKESL
jgi:alcohol dehydrogenase YqhD (iron-dependent ADH family)